MEGESLDETAHEVKRSESALRRGKGESKHRSGRKR